jgi:hypothetical protein
MEALGGRGGIAPTHYRPLRPLSEWSASRPSRAFTPGKRTPGTHCTGGWVGPRAGLDTEVRGKILCPRRGSKSDRPVVQPVVRHYTDWANTAPIINQYGNKFTRCGLDEDTRNFSVCISLASFLKTLLMCSRVDMGQFNTHCYSL